MTTSETPTGPDLVERLRSYAEDLRLPEWVIDPVKSTGPDLLVDAATENTRLRAALAAEGREDPEPRPASGVESLADKWEAMASESRNFERIADDESDRLVSRAEAAMLSWCAKELRTALAAGGASAVPAADAAEPDAAALAARTILQLHSTEGERCEVCNDEAPCVTFLEASAAYRTLDASAVPVDRPQPRVTVDDEGCIFLDGLARPIGRVHVAATRSDVRHADAIAALRAALAGDRPQITDVPDGMTAERLNLIAGEIISLRHGMIDESLTDRMIADLRSWAAALGDPRPDPGPSEPPQVLTLPRELAQGDRVTWDLGDGDDQVWTVSGTIGIWSADGETCEFAYPDDLRLAAGVPEETPGAEPPAAEEGR